MDLRGRTADLGVYRLLADAVRDYAIYLLDEEGRVSTWSAGAERVKGYRAEEVLGQHFSIFFTEEDRRNGLPNYALAQARLHGQFESEGWRVRKDGSRLWAMAVVAPVHDESGQFIGFAKVTRDITERHAAQQALLESERRFRLLVQGVVDYAIFMLEPDGTIANWNSGARRIKGYEDSEIVGRHFSEFYTPEDRANGVPARALREAELTGRFEAEGWRVRKNGTRFWASVVIDAIRDEAGQLIGFAKVTRDLTERREAQRALADAREQLVQAQKLEALGQLTGGVAHDFNNILQVITAGLAIAEKLPPNDPRLREIHQEMRSAAARGANLTSQLLAFSRRSPIRMDVVPGADAIRQAASLFSRTLPANIRVELDLEPGLWPMRIDVSQFELAMLNLAVNARDAMPSGGELRVRAWNLDTARGPQGQPGPFVAVSLRDTGAGIPEEILTRVFEPFFTTKPLGKGTGLGLSQVHGFVNQSGGTVTVESKVGEGTEITLLLPAIPAGKSITAADGRAGPEEQRAGLARRLAILVVDDDAAVGRLTVGMLEGAGHKARLTLNAREALQALEEEQFDLLLSDVVMPGGMGGVELARHVQRRWPDLPVLLATGYAGNLAELTPDLPRLQKPFTAIELVGAINSVVAGPVAIGQTADC